MPVMDEFKEERAALKNGTLKEKLSYFMEYYKWHVVAAVAIIVFVVSMLHHLLTSKDSAFYAAFINSFPIESSEEHVQGFAQYAGIDLNTYSVLIDDTLHLDFESPSQDSLASSQKLMAYLAASEIDVFLSNEAVIQQYAYNESFHDLRDILTQEQIDRYEPYFFYLDQTVADAVQNALANPDFDYDHTPDIPNPWNPEAMDQPIPVGISLESAASLSEIYYFGEDGPAVIAVVTNSPHPETPIKYIEYLLDYPAAP